LWVEKIIVDTPVQNIDGFKPVGGAHHDSIVERYQITPFDQFDAHLLRQKRVFVVSRIVDARRQQRDFGRVHRRGKERLQRRQQATRILIHRPNVRRFEDLRKRPLHDAAVFQDVRNARGTAQIVLQNIHLAVAIAHQIGAGDMAPNLLRRIESDAFFSKRARRLDQIFRNDFVFDNFLLMINIVDE
jgi:hypothetical protein